MTDKEIQMIVELVSQRVCDTLTKQNMLPLPGPDFSLSEISEITGISRSKLYTTELYGRYICDGVVRVKREEFLSRRGNGQDIARKKNEPKLKLYHK